MSGALSARGTKAADPRKKLLLWEALDNVWNVESNKEGFVNVGVAENALMHDVLTSYMNQNFHLLKNGLTYGDAAIGSKLLRKAIANFLTTRMFAFLPVTPEHIVVTSGVTSALETCAFNLADDGDGVLLGRPYYSAFLHDFEARAKVKVVPVGFEKTDPFSEEATQCYEHALQNAEAQGTKIRALVLCNPHNPLGRCYPEETLVMILRFCNKHQIHLISDEIYALSVWENPDFPNATTFTSILSLDVGKYIDPKFVHVLWGLSKDFGANGIRLGCLIIQNNTEFTDACKQNALFSYPSSPTDHLATRILSDTTFVDTYITENRRRMAAAWQYATTLLSSHKIPFLRDVNAAFFIWVDLGLYYRTCRPDECRDLDGDDERLEDRIAGKLYEGRVFIGSGARYGSMEAGYFRLVFTQERGDVREAVERVVAAIGPVSAEGSLSGGEKGNHVG